MLLHRRQEIAKKQQEQAGHRYSSNVSGSYPVAVTDPDERYFELGRQISDMKKGYNELQDVLGEMHACDVMLPRLAAERDDVDEPGSQVSPRTPLEHAPA